MTPTKETLEKLINAVKEENLTKTQLEEYHTSITYLDNILRLELAPLEKEEALFFTENKHPMMMFDSPNGQIPVVGTTKPDIEIKRMWRATEKGQRQIELSHYLKVTPKLLQSIRTRLYAIY